MIRKGGMTEEIESKSLLRILVVEDDSGISSMLQTILSEEGYKVTVAADGQVASSLIHSFQPDLVLLDLQVPNKNGYDLLKEIRQKDQEYGIFIPVIVLTGVYTSREDKVVCLDNGADDFLPKPFDIVELLARVRSLLRIRELNKRAQYLATHDHLTRCYNRRFLIDFLTREFQRFKRYKTSFSYMLIDVDHFKDVNDRFGHEMGDQVLTHLGMRLQDFFRAVDCVSRLGGDEFSIVLPDSGPKDVKKVAERLMEAMSTYKFKEPLPKDVMGKISFSMGVSCLPAHAKDIETLMRVADEALYASKMGGRNQFRLAQPRPS